MKDDLVTRWCFDAIQKRNLVYNACWEDPRLDREALRLGPHDEVVVITSAGCNALDYAIDEPRHVYAVDVNPWQNALLELKQAVIRRFEHAEAFAMFGRGSFAGAARRYESELRGDLSFGARAIWDRRIDLFEPSGPGSSFYFRGTSGLVARLVNAYINHVAHARDAVNDLLDAANLTRQRVVYEERLRDAFWTPLMRWAVGRDVTMSLLGVPLRQRHRLERQYPGGLSRFVEAAVETVFTRLPISDNYFWRVYLTGRYEHGCCPRYLTPEGFGRLKGGLVDRVSVHTATVAGFLRAHREPVSRFVLLDHMDWFGGERDHALAEEWQAIVDRASSGAVVLWRSAGLDAGFVHEAPVTVGGRPTRVGEILRHRRDQAARLHELDRVHTYGSFHIAEISAEAA